MGHVLIMAIKVKSLRSSTISDGIFTSLEKTETTFTYVMLHVPLWLHVPRFWLTTSLPASLPTITLLASDFINHFYDHNQKVVG